MWSDPEYQIDSIDYLNGNLLCALSRLEGNIWDGKLVLMGSDGHVLQEKREAAGLSVCRAVHRKDVAIVGRDDGWLSVHSGQDLSVLQQYAAHDDIISSIAVNDLNSNIFGSVGYDGVINVYSLEIEKPISSTVCSSNVPLYDLAFSNHSEHTACTVGKDGFARVWDCRSLDDGCSQIVSLDQIGSAVSWSSVDNTRCIVGMVDGRVAIIDWKMSRVVETQKFHSSRVNRLRRAYDINNINNGIANKFVSCSDDMTSLLFDELSFESDTSESSSGHMLRPGHRCVSHSDFVTDAIGIMIRTGQKLDSDTESEGVCDLVSCSVDRTVFINSLPL